MTECFHKFQFFIQLHQTSALALENVAENIRQLADVIQGVLIILLPHERRNAIQ